MRHVRRRDPAFPPQVQALEREHGAPDPLQGCEGRDGRHRPAHVAKTLDVTAKHPREPVQYGDEHVPVDALARVGQLFCVEPERLGELLAPNADALHRLEQVRRHPIREAHDAAHITRVLPIGYAHRVGLALEDVRAAIHRLFIASDSATLRKEDEQKSREVTALVARLSKLRRDCHLVDAAAGKASVGLVAAELLPIGKLTVLERDARYAENCRRASQRLARPVRVDITEADVADATQWPDSYDAVVALHACGPASDAVIDVAIQTRAPVLLLVPCCYGATLPFFAKADAIVTKMEFVSDERLRARMRSSIIDMERKLRLEAAGYETELSEFVGATVTPHNLLFYARHTRDAVRIERAKARLSTMHGS